MNNSILTNTLSGWMQSPLKYFCTEQISTSTYCGFENYYLSLMGTFYEKPPGNTEPDCGITYDPPDITGPTDDFAGEYYISKSCYEKDILKFMCVPKYSYLANRTVGEDAFECVNPYVEAPTGNLNGKNIIVSRSIETGDITTGSNVSITTESMKDYLNSYPGTGIPSITPDTTPTPYFNTLYAIQNNVVSPSTGKTQPKQGSNTTILIFAIIIGIIFLAVVIYFIIRSTKSKQKDAINTTNYSMYNPVNQKV